MINNQNHNIMQVTTKDGHIFVTAEQGNYVGLADESVFGESLSIGIGLTEADCIEKPIEEWPQPKEPEEMEVLP